MLVEQTAKGTFSIASSEFMHVVNDEQDWSLEQRSPRGFGAIRSRHLRG
ncbi:MAG: hypothetical protein WBG89_08115 [Ornithinimicrobium sp.]